MTSTYDSLITELQRIDALQAISGILGWDEQVNLPPGSGEWRGRQMAVYADLVHREISNPANGRLLDQLEREMDQLNDAQQVVVREARKDYDRATRIPAAFVARRAEAASKAYHAWAKARSESNFNHFAPYLQEQLELSIEETSFLNAPDPYDYWIDHFDPGMSADQIEEIFTPLLAGMRPLIETISNSAVKADATFFKGFPEDAQEKFLREVVTSMGFDFNRGRIDRAVHPFCSGHSRDTRMTTRFDVDNPLDSLTSAMHETGHALYEQGLPEEHLGTALGQSVGMAVHESQSRLWENQVGRGRAFWSHWEPKYRQLFPSQLNGVDSDKLYRAINYVGITPIRVDADEVTYNLHIMLRFNLERQLYSGALKVTDLPEAWNALSTSMLGYTPKNDREGCLQDIHWSGGMFGYFPSYCLGNVLAAQLWYTLLKQIPDIEEDFAVGRYDRLLKWLRQNVHCHGKRYKTQALAKVVTGEPLNQQYLLRYLRERYLPLYT